MSGEKKSKIVYYVVGTLFAIGATIGIVQLVNYNKRKKVEAKQNYLTGIIKLLKEKGIVFGQDDSLLMKTLAKFSDTDLNKIVAILKKEKLDANDKTEIFALIAKLLSPVEAKISDNSIFSTDGQKINSKNTGVIKAADGSGNAILYKINNKKAAPQNRTLKDGNEITINKATDIDSVIYYNCFLDLWVKATDVVVCKK